MLNNSYRWLYESLAQVKAYKYFTIISNINNQGLLLVSKAKRKRTIISILRTSKRCYKVSFNYIHFGSKFFIQEFVTFSNVNQLVTWYQKEVEPIYQMPPYKGNINKKGD